MRIGLLTGGGDCPGLNAVIRAVVRKGIDVHGHEFFGFTNGWAGVLAGEGVPLDHAATRGILHRGGTILGTSRTNPFKEGGPGIDGVRAGMESSGVEALIPIGGEDTLGVAGKLAEAGIPVIGVPKTIDNDLAGTDFTFGFQTAVQIATDAIDRLHTTAESHNRVIVVEVMGRHAGWIAAYSRAGGGGRRDPRPRAALRHRRRLRAPAAAPREGQSLLDRRRQRGRPSARRSAVQRSGQTDAFGHARLGGVAVALEGEIEARTGYETRMTILGHVQRGGTPNAFDRVLGTRFGVAAVDAVSAGEVGKMVALRGTEVLTVPLEEALAEPKLLDPAFYETAAVFFG